MAARPLARPPLVTLGAATALGSLAIQMFVPAMPAMARELNATPAVMQFGITVYLIGLTLGQLGGGPPADAFGRRPVMLGGIAVFAAGSLIAGTALIGPVMLAGRLAQALGGAACLVAGRSVIADTSSRERASSGMATLSLITLVSPTVAPTIGGVLVDIGGWRTIFFVLFGVATILGGISAFRLPETADASPAWRSSFRFGRLLAIPSFRRIVLGNACLSMALYAFLTASPFLLANQLGFSSARIGGLLLAVAASVMIGTLGHRRPAIARRSVALGKRFAIAGAAAMLAVGVAAKLSAILLILPMCVVALGVGLLGPANLATALNVDRSCVGTASSLYGAFQTLLSALATVIVAVLQPASQPALALMLLACVGMAVFTIPDAETSEVEPTSTGRR